MKKKFWSKLTTVLLIAVLLAGTALLLYPTVSNYYNSYLQSQIIVEYSDQVDKMEEEAYRKEWAAAESYNAALLERSSGFALTEELEAQYWNLLSTTDEGIMAYVEIPSINMTLPIAHGTDEETLSDYVGHIEWSSLPVGGESTHCVISGHRGLPSSELFTNIDHLEIGDEFHIHVLGQTLTYMVDNIAVVLPDDFDLLGIEQGKDYVTLVTCTPYGINSHRLLVRGVRVDTVQEETAAVENRLDNAGSPVDMMIVIPAVLGILVVIVVLFTLVDGRKKRNRKGNGENDAQK